MKRDKWKISLWIHEKGERRRHLKMWWVWQHCYMDAVCPKLTSRCDGFGSIVTWTLSAPNSPQDVMGLAALLHGRCLHQTHLKMWWVWQHCYMDAVCPKLTSRCDGFGSIVTWTMSAPNSPQDVMGLAALLHGRCLHQTHIKMWWVWQHCYMDAVCTKLTSRCDGVGSIVTWTMSAPNSHQDVIGLAALLHGRCLHQTDLKMWWVWQHCYMDAVCPKLTSRCDGFGSIVTWTLSAPKLTSRCDGFGSIVTWTLSAPNWPQDVMGLAALLHGRCLHQTHLKMWWVWQHCYMDAVCTKLTSRCDGFGSIVTWTLSVPNSPQDVMGLAALLHGRCLHQTHIKMWLVWQHCYMDAVCTKLTSRCDGFGSIVTWTLSAPNSPQDVMGLAALLHGRCLPQTDLKMWWVWQHCYMDAVCQKLTSRCDGFGSIVTWTLSAPNSPQDVMGLAALLHGRCLPQTHLKMWWVWQHCYMNAVCPKLTSRCDGFGSIVT